MTEHWERQGRCVLCGAPVYGPRSVDVVEGRPVRPVRAVFSCDCRERRGPPPPADTASYPGGGSSVEVGVAGRSSAVRP